MSDTEFALSDFQIGDSFELSPSATSRMITKILSVGGEFNLDGNLLVITSLPTTSEPAEASAPAQPPPAAAEPEPDHEEAPAEEPAPVEELAVEQEAQVEEPAAEKAVESPQPKAGRAKKAAAHTAEEAS